MPLMEIDRGSIQLLSMISGEFAFDLKMAMLMTLRFVITTRGLE